MKNEKLYLASNIKYLRFLNGKTQNDLAKACNKKNTAISNWEKGIREPDAIDLSIISNYFNVSVDDLILKNLKEQLPDSYVEEKISALEEQTIKNINDINNIEKILNALTADIINFLDLEFSYYPDSEEEIDFGLEACSNDITLYNELIKNDVIIGGEVLTQNKMGKVVNYIIINKNKLKNILDNKKSIHLKKWKDFTNSSLYKKYVDEIEKYNN